MRGPKRHVSLPARHYFTNALVLRGLIRDRRNSVYTLHISLLYTHYALYYTIVPGDTRITTKLFDVICHMILISSHFSEAARGGDRIHKCTESPHLVKLEYAVPTIRAM